MAVIGGLIGTHDRCIFPPQGIPGQVQNLYMTLQGQSAANATTSPPTPTSPNQLSLIWDAIASATYKIYRSSDGGVTFPYYDSSATNAYTDLSATNCVGSTAGSAGPPPVVNYNANTYLYKIAAVIGGVEGAQSATQSFVFYRAGQGPSSTGNGGCGGDFSFPGGSVTVDYTNTVGDPAGCIAFSFTSAFAGFQPYVGNNATKWNLWAGAFQYLNFDLKPTISGQSWVINTLRSGDVPIYNSSGTQTSINVTTFGPAPVNGTWGTYKAPLATILKDYGSNGLGPAVIQNAVYKFAIQDQTGNASGLWYMRNVYYSPS